MSSVDCFYTPPKIVSKMLRAVKSRPTVVADFTVGDGALVRAAAKRWRVKRVVATDIAESTVIKLKREFPQWSISRCDFLSGRSRRQSPVLKQYEKLIDLVLLNPPFSCRGSATVPVNWNEQSLRCSRAVAFVINALSFLKPRGEAVVVLPAGALKAQKDAAAWDLIRRFAHVELRHTNGHRSFEGCFPTTIIVHIKLRKEECTSDHHPVVPKKKSVNEKLTLVRGSLPMYLAQTPRRNQAWRPLVHSTELKRNRVELNKRRAAAQLKTFRGPAVLIHRVGLPNREKLALLKAQTEIVLSDCVIALRCGSTHDTVQLHNRLLRQWSRIERLYTGTGARYITVASLCNLLRSIGYEVVPDDDAGHQLRRACDSNTV